MVYFLFVLLASYLCFVILLMIGWKRVFSGIEGSGSSVQHVTIVVPVRNEVKVIEALLADLSAQDHPSYEVVIVDDQSNDGTPAVVERLVAGDHRFRCLKSAATGKKHALTYGIASANGSVIVTTDADCRVSPSWLAAMTGYFADPEVRMVFGGVSIRQESFFSSLQAIEFASLIGSGAASWSLGFPTLCNGANLAFRKTVFEEVGGYAGNAHIPSGDDEFLMRKIAAKYPQGLKFARNEQSIVTTRSVTFPEFIRQRLRWAGKWRHNTSVHTVLLAFYILFMQAATLACLVVLVTGERYMPVVAVSFLISKAALEVWFLHSVCRFLKVRWNWLAFMLLQIVYPVYVICIGLFSNFIPNNWKGRTV